jgi:tetratricopeptide (TPR) repeat protein
VARHLGLLALTAGRLDEAVAWFEEALAAATRMGARPYVAHAAHGLGLALAARGAAGDAERARTLGQDAERLARELGMEGLLRRLEARPAAPAAGPKAVEESASLRHEGDFWTLAYAGTVIRLKDSKGVAYLVHLLRHPGHEFHALDLGGDESGDGAPSSEGLTVAADSDAGEVLDAEARAAYRRRLTELRDELEEARRFNDLGRASGLEAEMDALADALSEGMGVGGRARRVGSYAERARINVTRALGRVLRKIEADSPPLGAYLAATVRTGIFCSYTPDPRRPIVWTL